MELIAVTTDIPIGEGEDGDIDHIKDILLHHLNSFKIKNKDLNDKIIILEEKLDCFESCHIQNDCEDPEGINVGDLKRQEDKNEKLKNKVYALEMTIQEKQTKIAYLEKKIDMAMDGASMDVSSIQDRKKHHLETIIEEQKVKLRDYSQELDKLRQYIFEVDKKSSASSVLKAEQEALLFSLRKDLKAALHSKEENDKKVRDLVEYRIRTEGKLSNIIENKDKLSQSEADLDEAKALIKRLENRLHLAETNLAVRTASMASKEEEIASMKTDLEYKRSELENSARVIQSLRVQLTQQEEKASIERKMHSETVNLKQEELNKMIRLHEESMASSQHAFDTAICDVKKDAFNKNQIARLLLDEKESAIQKLTEQNIALKEEVDSGQPADRKIFEMASRQATREGNLHLSRDARELAFQQLQSSLAVKDLDLARLQDRYNKLLSEVEELRCVKSRETVNMDYLKNIVLQVCTSIMKH